MLVPRVETRLSSTRVGTIRQAVRGAEQGGFGMLTRQLQQAQLRFAK